MRVFAIAQVHDFFQRQSQFTWELFVSREPRDARELVCDQGVITRGRPEHRARALLAESQGRGPGIGRHFRQASGVIRRLDDDRDEGVVLGRRAQHRWAADVDFFDLVRRGDAGLVRSGFKRVEVDHHQVDHADVVGLRGSDMVRVIAHAQQTAVDLGMERLHAPIHHLGKAGVFGNFDDRQAGGFQCGVGAAG